MFILEQTGIISYTPTGPNHCGQSPAGPRQCGYEIKVFASSLNEDDMVIEQDELTELIRKTVEENPSTTCEKLAEALGEAIFRSDAANEEGENIDGASVTIAPADGRRVTFTIGDTVP